MESLTLKVLVIDDEPGMRMGVQRALRAFRAKTPESDETVDFSVTMAESGEEGLEKIEADAPDILLLDHKLPGINGLEVLERIAERTESILTIMITAYASIETAVTATKRGAWDFLAKPFTPDELRYTIRKAAERIMLQHQARKLAQERRKVRFEFIRVLGHELKAPISAITGYLDLLENRCLGDDVSAYAHVINRSNLRLEQMRKLIMDLLDLTKIESGQMQNKIELCSLNELVDEAVETADVSARPRGIEITSNAGGDCQIAADKSEISIILNNLLTNAVKYNHDNGSVTIDLSQAADSLIIKVTDTGIGMNKEDIEHLFGEFVRIRNEKNRDIPGSGLGLSILKKLVDLYDGTIRVESEPGKGSAFAVTLSKNAREAHTGNSTASVKA